MTTPSNRRARRIVEAINGSDRQLAASPALLAPLDEQPVPALRWYRFERPVLLLGSAQRQDEADRQACAAGGIALHKRRSGGGAVLADSSLLLLDFALPRSHPLYVSDVTESYRWMGEVWVEALSRLGLQTRLVEIGEAREDTNALDPLTRRVCFGGLSPFEVMANNRKIVGLAQIRRRGGALYQAGVYLTWNPRHTAAVMAASADERARLAEQLARRVVGLEELLGRRPSEDELIGPVEEVLAERTGLTFSPSSWNDAERAAIEADLERYAPIG